MWLANWSVPQLADAPEREVIDEEIAEARWKWPQVLDEEWERRPCRPHRDDNRGRSGENVGRTILSDVFRDDTFVGPKSDTYVPR